MADLDDLLGDISNVDDRDGYDIDQEEDDADGILPGLDNVGIRSEVPSALATAAAIRRRRVPFREDDTNDNDDLGGGQSSLGRRGFEDNGEEDNYGDDDDDDDGDGRNYNPDYETLKALWTSELACPELLPHDAETVLQIVDDLSAQEEIINDLLLRSKQPPPLLQQSSTSRGGGGGGGGPTAELASLVAQITKMDSDRTRFMLVDLARTRMAKIENHAFHNRTLVDRMTEEEVRVLLYNTTTMLLSSLCDILKLLSLTVCKTYLNPYEYVFRDHTFDNMESSSKSTIDEQYLIIYPKMHGRNLTNQK